MIIQYQNKQRKYDVERFKPLIELAITQTIKGEKIYSYLQENNIVLVFSFTFTNNKNIKAMNMQYRNIDSSTDVLSFPLIENNSKIITRVPRDDVFVNGNLKELHLGDIVISVEKADKQAKRYKQSIEREMIFLTMHSTLHLIGYDHLDTNDEKLMIKRQKEIMNIINID